MSERVRNVVVGITALAGLVVGLFLLMLFGYLPAWLEGGYEVHVRMTNASGLTPGSRVRLSGIDIGRVTSVSLLDETHRGVEAVALVREEFRIPQDVQVEAQSPLLGGNPSLALSVEHLSSQQMRQWLATDGTAVIHGEALSLVSQFAGELKTAIRQPTQHFEKLVEQFDQINQQWNRVGKNLNQLLEMRSINQVDAGTAQGNIATMVVRADRRLGELKLVMVGLDRWVNDKQLRDDMAATAANARRLTQTGNESLHRLEKRYMAVADDLTGVIEAVHAVVEQARSGHGTAGKFLFDPSLYDNLNDTVGRFQVSLDEFRLLIQKWKAEGLPVHF